MGRIVTSVEIQNPLGSDEPLRFDALVDTGATHLTLPIGWKERLGNLQSSQQVEIETASQEIISAEIAGPVRITIEGFRPIYGEVLFIEMKPANGQYEPLVGYIPLEQAGAAVDMLGHRLIHVRAYDLK